MKASELVLELNKLMQRHGDLEVVDPDEEGFVTVTLDCFEGSTEDVFVIE